MNASQTSEFEKSQTCLICFYTYIKQENQYIMVMCFKINFSYFTSVNKNWLDFIRRASICTWYFSICICTVKVKENLDETLHQICYT